MFSAVIANHTTLILGAGASHPAYPLGAELRDLIINAAQNPAEKFDDADKYKFKNLGRRLQTSTIASIDAFLAEPENKELEEFGKYLIAAVLLPREQKAISSWYELLFNAVRGRGQGARLRIVTFNYDLSLEWALFRAFAAAYKLDSDRAKEMMDEAVEIIHVYGQLSTIDFGEIGWPGQRCYGDTNPEIESAAKGIHIIGRDPESPQFKKAQEAIASAEFIGILGFGYDETNIANLKLVELCQGKAVFTTAYEMGYGMRAWIRHIGLKQILFGHRDHKVGTFLARSGFLHWANVTGANGHVMHGAISEYLKAEKYQLPD